MTNPTIIPTNFRVPKDCRHKWVLFHGNEMIGGIAGVPGRKQINQMFREPTDKSNSSLESKTLDWIVFSIEHLRHLCNAE